ncbi:MAG: hypothetical protein Q9163_003022 [Psora crenata]
MAPRRGGGSGGGGGGSDYDDESSNPWYQMMELNGSKFEDGYFVAVIVFYAIFLVTWIGIAIWAATMTRERKGRGVVRAVMAWALWGCTIWFGIIIFVLSAVAAFQMSRSNDLTRATALAFDIIEGFSFITVLFGIVLAVKQLADSAWKPWESGQQPTYGHVSAGGSQPPMYPPQQYPPQQLPPQQYPPQQYTPQQYPPQPYPPQQYPSQQYTHEPKIAT